MPGWALLPGLWWEPGALCSQGHEFLLFECTKLPREPGCSWGHPSFSFAFTVFTWATAGMEISKIRSETDGSSSVSHCFPPSHRQGITPGYRPSPAGSQTYLGIAGQKTSLDQIGLGES